MASDDNLTADEKWMRAAVDPLAARVQPLPPADEPVAEVTSSGSLSWLVKWEPPEGTKLYLGRALERTPETAEPPALTDAARWRWFRGNCPTTMLVMMFGNGCENKTVAMAEAKIDAEIRALASTPPPEQASTHDYAKGVVMGRVAEGIERDIAALRNEQASTPRAEPAEVQGGGMFAPRVNHWGDLTDEQQERVNQLLRETMHRGLNSAIVIDEQGKSHLWKRDEPMPHLTVSGEAPTVDEGCLSLEDAAEAHFIDSDLQPQLLTKLDCFCEGALFAKRWLALPPSTAPEATPEKLAAPTPAAPSAEPRFYEGELPLKPIGYIRKQDGLEYAPAMMLYAHRGEAENGEPMAAMFSEDQVRNMLATPAVAPAAQRELTDERALAIHHEVATKLEKVPFGEWDAMCIAVVRETAAALATLSTESQKETK